MKVIYYILRGVRRVGGWLSPLVIRAMIPLKLWAWRTRIRWWRGVLLEVTTFIDFNLVFINIQNGAMRQYHRVWGGNFLFGKALMIVDHAVTAREIAEPTLRGNRFMGVDIVSNDPMAFVTNAGPITTAQPTRGLIRGYIDDQIMTERVRAFTVDSLREECADLLAEWSADPEMLKMGKIRGAVTRLYIRILAEKTIPKNEADAITFHYTRRFVELSLFGRYLPSMLGLLGTREAIRRDAYIPLRRMGLDNLAIDMTLFAAMFSVGTIVMKMVDLAAEHDIDYAALTAHEKMGFVIESLRLHPTVTSVHRIVESEETVQVRGRDLRVQPGDELAYPFVCSNRDPKGFVDPEAFRLDRPHEEAARVLSWSAGPHVCPAKDLSILTTVILLDVLAERDDLRRLRIYNLEF